MSDERSKAKAMSKASEPDGKAPATAEGKRSLISWLLGWVMVPGIILGMIFGAGVLVGAHLHDSWLSRLVVWCVELFA